MINKLMSFATAASSLSLSSIFVCGQWRTLEKLFRNKANAKVRRCIFQSSSVFYTTSTATTTATATEKNRSLLVLGLECSCDDTGAAVVTSNGEILGEALYNQGKIHRQFGGIIPTVARDLHQEKVEHIVNTAVNRAQVSIQDVDALAITVKPGMALSLLVGLNYIKKLSSVSMKPVIPIHHMEAHALTARLTHQIAFPYLTLLMSGGHCLLALAHSVNNFSLLGSCIDTSPGDMLDKVARRLKLKNLPELQHLCGGAAIEHLAQTGDPYRFMFPSVMTHRRDCNFSFAGLQFHATKIIAQQEAHECTAADQVIPSVADVCASLQLATLKHMAKRLYRGFLFADSKEMLPKTNRMLVLSGGVASNTYLRSGLAYVAAMFDCDFACPPVELCTDNGVMVAWNGVEKLKEGLDIMPNADGLVVEHRSPFGTSLEEEVVASSLRVPTINFDNINCIKIPNET